MVNSGNRLNSMHVTNLWHLMRFQPPIKLGPNQILKVCVVLAVCLIVWFVCV
jgi:hypothetical protein